MASSQSRKRKSTAEDEYKNGPQASTPTGSPARKKMKITQSQKQALIDNLQLEITERARHLRAHYALQSTDLRSRIERRINRIPMSLRKATMGQLLSRNTVENIEQRSTIAAETKGFQTVHAATTTILPASQSHPLPPIPQSSSSKPVSPTRPAPVATRPAIPTSKPTSVEDFHIASDKENDETTTRSIDTIPNPKNPKRTKTATGAPRAVSRAGKATSVLSPKSHNSRTLPRSPIKDYPQSPTKPAHHSYIARPTSPLKPASPLKTAASAATSAISASLHGMVEHAKRGAGATARGLGRTASNEKSTAKTKMTAMMGPPPRPGAHPQQQQQEQTRTISSASMNSNSSNTSVSSTSTTVVKKKAGGGGKKWATTVSQIEKKPAANTKTAMKKNATTVSAAAAKKAVVAEPAAGRRVLRKRY